MSTQSAFFHALLRPAILQILRATGYHAARPSVVDSLTDIAARYLSALCLSTASHATHNHGDAGAYTVVDVRMALQDAGALLPERTATEQAWRGGGDEDGRGAEAFLGWFGGERMGELMDMRGGGGGDGEMEGGMDYLSALKKKHCKTAEDNKYAGTVIGKPLETTAEVQVEGGPVATIDEWIRQRTRNADADAAAHVNGNGRDASCSPTASSGLSSVGSRLGDEEGDDGEMDLS